VLTNLALCHVQNPCVFYKVAIRLESKRYAIVYLTHLTLWYTRPGVTNVVPAGTRSPPRTM